MYLGLITVFWCLRVSECFFYALPRTFCFTASLPHSLGDIFSLLLERERKGEKATSCKREASIGCLLHVPGPVTEPTTWSNGHGERKRGREISINWSSVNPGPGPQPRHVLRLGIEPATFSNPQSTEPYHLGHPFISFKVDFTKVRMQGEDVHLGSRKQTLTKPNLPMT
ncbi:hypothetical protein HJG60_007895 [Phyllostomus discolor]|uniref:Secreted protein n=1 Tax=Phyllostomus discolor TaxID=89673 RepID=A0A834BII0_9CHIR|nr:hypothetical protein HJG60_007895 [Phyllostomus discolor]